MPDFVQPGPLARRAMLRAALGAGAGVIVTMGMQVSRAADTTTSSSTISRLRRRC